MEDPYLAAGSVPAATSDFYAAELQAFVAMAKMRRPSAWSQVEQLQRLCRDLSPATTAGADQANNELTSVR